MTDKIKKKFDTLEKLVTRLSDKLNKLQSENIKLKSDLEALKDKSKYLEGELLKAHQNFKEKDKIIKKLSKLSELINNETEKI
ncbi:MAG: hypothetical protein KA059_01985 [Elusimicrobiales bacterium]|jgi:uncharacterized coiled-coil DUF342 family protein|nr:hypothetical protein [Elusimicrobiales bacterium]NLH38919.1 hypothetical protein [Elusimicrobiota bacterium]